MESKVEELKNMGIDILPIIDGIYNPKVQEAFHKIKMYSDVVIPEWNEEKTIAFSNRVYNIVNRTSEKRY